MANRGNSSKDKNVQEKGQGGGRNESPGQERRDVTPTPRVFSEGDGAKQVPRRRERVAAPAGEGFAEKKRGRKDDVGASSSGVEKQKKLGELPVDIPIRSSCYMCGRKFHH